jgi:hypothetical protein
MFLKCRREVMKRLRKSTAIRCWTEEKHGYPLLDIERMWTKQDDGVELEYQGIEHTLESVEEV